ncbi:MAG: ABC transporter substrate-binding protein [Beijerinckiaceae bacterium]|nr:ABC transporter substrate-binding protein [Beijerinckiaceae bacterium]MDO9443444.1 ABC transporter substrate-binding protein [Beijerinckiaceae bacterium]
MRLRTYSVTGIVAGLMGFAVAFATPVAAQTKVQVAVANRSISSLPMMVAKGKDFFKDEGLDVSLEYFTGGPPATAALIGGSAQFLVAAPQDMLKAIKQGQPLVAIGTVIADYTGSIVMRKDLADKLGRKPTIEDLKGKRIGTLARGGFTDVSTRYMLMEKGIDPEKDVVLTPVRGADRQLAAGRAGELDANALVDPSGYIAVEQMKDWVYVVDVTAGEGPKIFHDLGFIALQTTRDYLAKNRPVAEKMVRAMVRAQTFISDPKNEAEATELASQVLVGMDKEALRGSVKASHNAFRPAFPKVMIDNNMELLLRNKLIEAPAPAYETAVDASFEPIWKTYAPK